MPRRKTRSRGLTLVELMVVIAVIAILAEMIFYIGTKTRERAHAVQGLVDSRGGE